MLRARLFATYLLLIAITVGVMAAALILILSARAEPPQATYQRLAAIAQGVPLREILVEAGSRIFATPREREAILETELTRLAADRNVRILVVNARARTSVYDS